MPTVALLLLSNIFMTVAWYGHLKFKTAPLIVVILLSWLLALPEYSLAVPANRLGAGHFSLVQLKIIQECISLTIFLVFAKLAFKESLKWNTWVAMGLIIAAVYFAFLGNERH